MNKDFEEDEGAYDEGELDDGNAWAVSYGDLMSVLLCFMILLLSISVINPNKFEILKNNKFSGVRVEETSIADLQKKIEQMLREEKLEKAIKVDENMLGVDISIRDKLLFNSGSAILNPKSLHIFKKLLSMLQELPTAYSFQIEGHTDDQPIATDMFPSNWYLSSYRALTVLDLFLKYGIDPKRLEVQGFAETRPEVLSEKEGRMSVLDQREMNRRVVIKVR